MNVYSYYYGASVESGICIQAQSVELRNVPIRSMLKELSSMHVLKSSEHDGEMLSYMLSASGYRILGTSYLESPKSSGYGRSAPCGLIYVAPTSDVNSVTDKLGKIVNFVQFQKPTDASPTPLKGFPLNESGYSYHSGSGVLKPLIDGLIKVLLSKDTVLLVGLPKGRSSEYATARYAIAEALNYLPVSLRTKVSFFTGLPVADNENDTLKGYDNAVKFGANVVFCASEHFAALKRHRTCVCVDMEQPTTQVEAFAAFITDAPGTSAALAQINDCISGNITYEKLNKAAQNVRDGKVETMITLRKKLKESQSALSKSKDDCLKLAKDLDKVRNHNSHLERKIKILESERSQYQTVLKGIHKTTYGKTQKKNNQPAKKTKSKRPLSGWVLISMVVVAALALFALCAWLFYDFLNDDTHQTEQPARVIAHATGDSATLPEVKPVSDNDENQANNQNDQVEEKLSASRKLVARNKAKKTEAHSRKAIILDAIIDDCSSPSESTPDVTYRFHNQSSDSEKNDIGYDVVDDNEKDDELQASFSEASKLSNSVVNSFENDESGENAVVENNVTRDEIIEVPPIATETQLSDDFSIFASPSEPYLQAQSKE